VQLRYVATPFAELSGQSRRKIRPPREKIWSPSNVHFLKVFGLKKKKLFCLCDWENNNISWNSLELERIRGRKETIF
jgi:hypothetical protein